MKGYRRTKDHRERALSDRGGGGDRLRIVLRFPGYSILAIGNYSRSTEREGRQKGRVTVG